MDVNLPAQQNCTDPGSHRLDPPDWHQVDGAAAINAEAHERASMKALLQMDPSEAGPLITAVKAGQMSASDAVEVLIRRQMT
jgi:hypothetical protein